MKNYEYFDRDYIKSEGYFVWYGYFNIILPV